MNGAVDGAVPRRAAANERRSGEDVDRAIVRAAQAGLPRVRRPYHAIAETLGVAPETVVERMRAMLESGAIRPVLWKTLPFDGVAEAHQLMRDNKHAGKISVLVGAEREGLGKTADGPGAILAEVG